MHPLLHKASNYLSRLWNRQLLVFIFFLFLSTAFWVFMAGKEVKEADIEVPIVLAGVPNNVVITTDPPKKITLTLKDEVFTLLNYKRKHYQAVINWADIDSSDGHVKLQTAALLKPFYATFHNTTQIVSARPETIEFYFNYGLSKTVDVVIQGHIEADSTYHIIACDVTPRKVTVYGAKNVLDTITGAYIMPVNITGVKDNVKREATFQPVKGLKYVPGNVTLTVFADRIMEKTVQVPVRGTNFPAGKVLRTFPPKVNVTFQVGAALEQKITAENFVLVLNYEELKDKTDNRTTLQLKSIPTGVQRARITPSEVEFIIEEDNSDSGEDN